MSAVAVPVAPPLNVTIVPLPLTAGVIVPEMLNVGIACAVKSTPPALAPLAIVTGRFVGVNVKPVFAGVTV